MKKIKTWSLFNEGERNWEKEKSWQIKDEFPIDVYVKKGWTGKYYVISVPEMKMSYETFNDLGNDNLSKDSLEYRLKNGLSDTEEDGTKIIPTDVSVSSYDYSNGEANWTASTLEDVKNWELKYNDKVNVHYEN